MTGVLLLLWWCDVAVDLQTDKTQCSDTWWAAPEHESVVARGGQAGTWYAGPPASWDDNSVLSSPVCPPLFSVQCWYAVTTCRHAGTRARVTREFPTVSVSTQHWSETTRLSEATTWSESTTSSEATLNIENDNVIVARRLRRRTLSWRQCPHKLFATNILCETVYSDLVCNLDCKLFKFLSPSVSRPSSD